MITPYERFLQGDLPFAEFAAAVADSYSFCLRDTEREVSAHFPKPAVSITVHGQNLVPMLRRYLTGHASAAEVSVWAFVIATVDVFDLSNLPDDTARRVQSLSSAPIAHNVTPSVVQGLLRIIEPLR